MDRKMRSTSRPRKPSLSAGGVQADVVALPVLPIMDIDSALSFEIINHWEYRARRFTLFRGAVSIFLLLVSLPQPQDDTPAVLPYLFTAGFGLLLLLLMVFFYMAEWSTDSGSGQVRKSWLGILRDETSRHTSLALAAGALSFFIHWAVPKTTAHLVDYVDCACGAGPPLEFFKGIVDKIAAFVLSLVVIWIIPKRMALLRNVRARADLPLWSVVVFSIWAIVLGVLCVLAFKGFCFQLAQGSVAAADAASEDDPLLKRLVPSGYVAASASLVVVLIGVSYSGEWLTESNPEQVHNNWSDTMKVDTISYGRVGLVAGASYITHRFLVPLLNAWVLNTTGCSCSSGPRMDQFKTVVNSTGVFLLSSAVVWSIPNRLALLQHSTFRDTAALVLLAVFGYVLCLAGVYAASLKAGEAFCYQAGGKCAGEIVLKVVDLAGKIGRRDFGKLDSVIGWSMTALGLQSKK
ncbi:hypothetical protein TI39_contig405g00016 [Zymoseptoria brevis]|uniref:Uncharacterized protein n=1 Tax=Zymoseptoria brevis TaxID=1047168 RepID=A0A0F4GND1_9PEZI|nr:hypothetical protein TI39_contig405g00016 [Zymoseptoria brevis]